ncbi:MAG: zinc-ribbon domain-containing protein [Candidatus Aminicenantes bacterium]
MTKCTAACPYCFGRKKTGKNPLPLSNPELAKQWHPSKNKGMKPEDVSMTTKKKVWWLCENGHIWESRVITRYYYPGCPYCNRKAASKDYNLELVNPTLARQWHPTLNGKLKPTQVTPMSNKKIWWKCEKGHRWRATVSDRGQGRGCPYCAGKKPSKGYNLRVTHPELVNQWHPTKNADLTPEQVTPASNKKVWWKCEKGHEWRTKILSRTIGGTRCPYCVGSKPSKEYNLRVIHPELANQWHPEKNDLLKPEQVTPGSKKKVWWMCKKKHEWRASVSDRRRGNGCPYCAGRKPSKEYNLRAIHPQLAKQWHPEKNGHLKPEQVTPGSNKKVWWMCGKGHEWRANITSRSQGIGCPYCSGKRPDKEYNLLTIHPELAQQWHPDKNGNLTPEQVTPGSRKKVWWKCKKKHEWKAAIASRSAGTGCPYCAGKKASKQYNLRVVHPELAQQWHPQKNGDLTPEQVTPGSNKKVWWRCKKKHEWRASVSDRRRGNGCPYCSGKKASKQYNLMAVNPELAQQWHPDKNGHLTPEQVTPSSGKKVWWKCKEGHVWKAQIAKRSWGRGCPYCARKKR